MPHLVRKEPWGITDLDLEQGHVFVRQDWRYDFVELPGLAPWTFDQRFAYERSVDRFIWKAWSFGARLQVSWANEAASHQPASRDLMKRFGDRGLTLSFDVRSVVGPADWQVSVRRLYPGAVKPRPQTDFARRTVDLYENNDQIQTASRPGEPTTRFRFSVAAHEFGHAIGYANPRGHIDEYEAASRYYGDVHSIMNIGRQLRARHFSLITETLGHMVPACAFRAVIETKAAEHQARLSPRTH